MNLSSASPTNKPPSRFSRETALPSHRYKSLTGFSILALPSICATHSICATRALGIYIISNGCFASIYRFCPWAKISSCEATYRLNIVGNAVPSVPSCHCEPVRRLVWQSPAYNSAKPTLVDCHIATLLAMTTLCRFQFAVFNFQFSICCSL